MYRSVLLPAFFLTMACGPTPGVDGGTNDAGVAPTDAGSVAGNDAGTSDGNDAGVDAGGECSVLFSLYTPQLVDVSGGLAVAESSGGIYIYDATTDDAMATQAFFSNDDFGLIDAWSRAGTTLLLHTATQLHSVDIEDPANPVALGSTPLTPIAAEMAPIDMQSTDTRSVIVWRAYLQQPSGAFFPERTVQLIDHTDANAIQVLDAQTVADDNTPGDPSELSDWTLSYPYLYMLRGDTPVTLHIYDLTDDTIAERGTLPLPSGIEGRARVTALGSRVFVATDGELREVDASDPDSPALAYEQTLGELVLAHGLKTLGDSHVVMNGRNSGGVRIFRVGDEAPAEVASLDEDYDGDDYNGGTVLIDGTTLWYDHHRWDATVADAPVALGPHPVGNAESNEYAWDMAVGDEVAYVAGNSGLRRFSLATPSSPEFLGTIDIGATYAVTVVGTTAVVNTLEGNRIFDLTDPAAPIAGGLLPDGELSAYGTDVMVRNGTSLQTYDLTDVGAPIQTNIWELELLPGPINDIAIGDGMAIVAVSYEPGGLFAYTLPEGGEAEYRGALLGGEVPGYYGPQKVQLRQEDSVVFFIVNGQLRAADFSDPSNPLLWPAEVSVGSEIYVHQNTVFSFHALDGSFIAVDVSDPAVFAVVGQGSVYVDAGAENHASFVNDALIMSFFATPLLTLDLGCGAASGE